MIHDVEVLKRECQCVYDTLFEIGMEYLKKRWAEKRVFEAQIEAMLETSAGGVSVVQAIQREPITVVQIIATKDALFVGQPTTLGVGWAVCSGKDEWDGDIGYAIAYKKAIRHAARQLAGLE